MNQWHQKKPKFQPDNLQERRWTNILISSPMLTEKIARETPPPASGVAEILDDGPGGQRGLMLRITAGGVRPEPPPGATMYATGPARRYAVPGS